MAKLPGVLGFLVRQSRVLKRRMTLNNVRVVEVSYEKQKATSDPGLFHFSLDDFELGVCNWTMVSESVLGNQSSMAKGNHAC